MSPRCQDDDKKGPPPSKVRLPPEVNIRRLQLSVPKMSISAGNYTLVFSLSYEGVPLRKAACIRLSVMSKKLVPIIEGGTYRVWSKTQDLHLSAEQSYDRTWTRKPIPAQIPLGMCDHLKGNHD